MKKTITLPDGSVEVVEGTAEELAEYERKRQTEGAVKPTKKRKLLNEETVRAIAREEAAKVVPIVVHTHGFCTCPVCCPYKPIWIIPQVLEPFPPLLPYVGDPLPLNPPWITITSTSDKVVMPNGSVPAVSGYLIQN